MACVRWFDVVSFEFDLYEMKDWRKIPGNDFQSTVEVTRLDAGSWHPSGIAMVAWWPGTASVWRAMPASHALDGVGRVNKRSVETSFVSSLPHLHRNYRRDTPGRRS